MTTIYVSDKDALPKRAKWDFYPTPLAVCEDALSFLPDKVQPQCILDPGAGAGAWGIAARKRFSSALITGVDVREETCRPSAYNFWLNQDFLLTDSQPAFDLVIGNPPYNVAEKFVRHSMAMLEPDGFCIMLLRLNFLEGQARARGLHRMYPIKQLIVRAGRVSFTGDGHSNATAYGYFLWQKGWCGEPTIKWSLAA